MTTSNMTKGDSSAEPTCNFFVRLVLKYISQEYFIPSNSRLGITQAGSDPTLYLNNLKKRRYGIDRKKSSSGSSSQYVDRAKYLFNEEENNKFIMAHDINRHRNNRDHENHGDDRSIRRKGLNIDRVGHSATNGPDVQILGNNTDELSIHFGPNDKRADNIGLNFQGHECRFLDNILESSGGPKAPQEVFTRHRYVYTEFDDERNQYDSRTLTIKNCQNEETIKESGAFNDYVVHADEGEGGDGEEEEEEHHVVHIGHHTDEHEEGEEGEEGEAQHGDHVDHIEHHDPSLHGGHHGEHHGEHHEEHHEEHHGGHHEEEYHGHHAPHQGEHPGEHHAHHHIEVHHGEEGGEGGEGEEEEEDEHWGLHHHGVEDVDEWQKADEDDFFDEDDNDDDAADMPEVSEIAEDVITHQHKHQIHSDIEIAHRFTHYHHGEFGKKDGLPGTAPFDTRFPNANQKYFLPSNCRLGITQQGSDPALFLNNSKKYESGNERTSLNLKHWFDNQYTNLANYLLDIAHNQHGQRKNRYHDDHGNDIWEESDFDNSELQSFKTNDELYVNFGTKNESADAIELNQHEGHECRFLDNKLQSNNDPEAAEHHQEVFTPHGYIYTQFDNEMNDYVSRRVSIKNCENVESTKIKEPLDEYDVHSAEGDDTEGDDEDKDKGQMLSTVFCDNIINKPFNDYVVHAAEGDAAGEGEEEEQEPQVIHGGHHGIRVPAEGEEEEGEECKEGEEPTEGEECKDSKRKKHGDHYDHIEHQEEEEGTEGEEVDEKKKAEEEKKAQLRRHGAVPQDVWSKADADDFFDEDDADDGPGALPEVSKAADEAILNASANITINHRFNHYHHGEFGKKDGLPGTAPFETRHPNANQTKQCFFMFVDYHRCAAKLGDDVYRCHYYRHVYETICPNEWIQKWQDQMDAGTFPFKIQS